MPERSNGGWEVEPWERDSPHGRACEQCRHLRKIRSGCWRFERLCRAVTETVTRFNAFNAKIEVQVELECDGLREAPKPENAEHPVARLRLLGSCGPDGKLFEPKG